MLQKQAKAMIAKDDRKVFLYMGYAPRHFKIGPIRLYMFGWEKFRHISLVGLPAPLALCTNYGSQLHFWDVRWIAREVSIRGYDVPANVEA